MRRFDPFDRRAMLLSIALHGALFVVGWAASLDREPTIEFISYEIDLVSPPPAVEAEEYTPAEEELVVERPPPQRPPEPEPRPEPEPEPAVTVETRQPEPRPAPPTPEPQPSADPRPAAGPEPTTEPQPTRTGEGIDVSMKGLHRDYPDYYNNIILQIQRCFRWRDGGSWEAVVYFSIQRDGSVRDLRFVNRSGNASFDFEAMGAVECAGQGRLGPLPEDLPYESQPVNFQFRPGGGQ
ncbi:MAG: TonB C-terminal domain-containing protein [Gemmatimonadetes bacterium]|nr:TonB C-terminal domain-containing protein [Gemmatimonadota bacterium]